MIPEIDLDYDDKVIPTNDMDFNNTENDVIPAGLSISVIKLGKSSLLILISPSTL